jgi:hypothetical protein
LRLVLKRASASRPSGEWSDDDFDVLADGAIVGGNMKVTAVPEDAPGWSGLTPPPGGHNPAMGCPSAAKATEAAAPEATEAVTARRIAGTPTYGYEPTAKPQWPPSPRAGGGSDEHFLARIPFRTGCEAGHGPMRVLSFVGSLPAGGTR